MDKKVFLKQLTILIYRLFFYCAIFVDIYFCVKYYIILNQSFSDWTLIVPGIIQLIYCIWTIIIEQLTCKFYNGLLPIQQFAQKRGKIRFCVVSYVLCPMAMAYVYATCFLDPNSDQSIFGLFNNQSDMTLNKVIYGAELVISISLSAYSIYAYRLMKRQIDSPQVRQPLLPNVDSINSNEGNQAMIQDEEPQGELIFQNVVNMINDLENIVNMINNQQQGEQQPQQQQQQQQQQQGQQGRFTLARSFYQQDGNFFYDAERNCVICIEQMLENEKIIELPCLHTFHSNCIRAVPNHKCPTCRNSF